MGEKGVVYHGGSGHAVSERGGEEKWLYTMAGQGMGLGKDLGTGAEKTR